MTLSVEPATPDAAPEARDEANISPRRIETISGLLARSSAAPASETDAAPSMAPGDAPAARQRPHFETLDALRGVAALCVMLHHFGAAAHERLGETGFIGVDFFFVLSGFVIAHAYDRRLAGGYPFRDYLLARIIRLYPMVLMAGSVALLFSFASGAGISQEPWSRGLVMALSGLLLIPYFGGFGRGFAMSTGFPLNDPSWSLSEELAVNVLYGAVGPRLGVRATAALTVVFGVALVVIGVKVKSLSFGWQQGDWLIGFVRCAFTFLYGAAIAKVMMRRTVRTIVSNHAAVAIGAVLFFILCLPYVHRVSGALVGFMMVAGFPLIVALGTRVQCSGLGAKLASLAGRLSYPMYLLHFPIMATFGAIAYRAGLKGHAAELFGLFCAAYVILLSWFILKLDEPLRKFLSSRLPRVRTGAASAP